MNEGGIEANTHTQRDSRSLHLVQQNTHFLGGHDIGRLYLRAMCTPGTAFARRATNALENGVRQSLDSPTSMMLVRSGAISY